MSETQTGPVAATPAPGSESAHDTEPKIGGFHHISDVGVWKHADRNYWVFVALCIFGGFIGLDHFYLRSNETAMKKLLVNIVGLGFWYFYDLIQIWVDGAKIRKEGLSSPLDWIQGIGRGMFAGFKTKGPPEYAAPKSYMLYTILAVALGAFGADKFYIGNTFQGLVKFISVFSILFTIFGLVWVAYDAIMALFFTKSLLKDGISVPAPFSLFFRGTTSAANLFEVQEVKEEAKKPFSVWDYIPLVGIVRSIGNAGTAVAKEVVGPLVGPSVSAVLKHAETAQKLTGAATSLATSTLAQAPGLVSEVTSQMSEMANPVALVQQIAQQTQAQRLQTGGAVANQSGAAPVLAGTLTALVIAGGLKGLHDFLSNR